jgi:hypothetical protein
MAGELLVIIPTSRPSACGWPSPGKLSDAPGLMSTLLIGILIDALFFGTLERTIRARRGLVDNGG